MDTKITINESIPLFGGISISMKMILKGIVILLLITYPSLAILILSLLLFALFTLAYYWLIITIGVSNFQFLLKKD